MTDGGIEIEADEEEKKHNQRISTIENQLRKINSKIINLELEVENFKKQCKELFD